MSDSKGEVLEGRSAYLLQTCERFTGKERPTTCPTKERIWENYGPCFQVPDR